MSVLSTLRQHSTVHEAHDHVGDRRIGFVARLVGFSTSCGQIHEAIHHNRKHLALKALEKVVSECPSCYAELHARSQPSALEGLEA